MQQENKYTWQALYLQFLSASLVNLNHFPGIGKMISIRYFKVSASVLYLNNHLGCFFPRGSINTLLPPSLRIAPPL